MDPKTKQISEKNQKRSILIALAVVAFFAIVALGFALWDFRLEKVLGPDDSGESAEMAPILDDIQNEGKGPEGKKGNSELALKTAQNCIHQSSLPQLQSVFDGLKAPVKLDELTATLKTKFNQTPEVLIFQSLEIDTPHGGELLSYERADSSADTPWKITFLQNDEEGLGMPAPIPPELKGDNPQKAFDEFRKRGTLKVEEISHKISISDKAGFNYMTKNSQLFALKLNFDGHGLGCNVNENDLGALSCVCFQETLDADEPEQDL